ncbi:MAG: hypothetical protein MRY57_00210 [Candidatus Pacebacteria bacterium]|nr:hypothetical protein [Candidatus Paceibacterota bacterium]
MGKDQNLDLDKLFDDLGDKTAQMNSVTSTLKSQVDDATFGVADVLSETGKTLEGMTSKVDTKKIVDATNDSALSDAKAFGKNLAGVMVDLQKILDTIGHGFEGVKDLNAEEKGWIEAAEQALEKAEQALQDANAISNNWWQRLLGREKKITAAKQKVKDSQHRIVTETARANEHHSTRLENEPLEEQLKRMITVVTLITNHVESKMGDIDIELGKIKVSQEGAFKIKEQASNYMEQYETQKKELEERLQVENKSLSELDPSSTEYTTQQKIVEDLAQEVNEIAGKFEVARSVFNSKQRFVDLHGIAIEALETQRKNLKADLAALKSDTKERENFYAGTIRSLQAAAMIKVTSEFEKAGVVTDRKSAEMLAAATVGSQRTRLERVEGQEGRMQDIDEVIKALMAKQREFALRTQKMNEQMSENYGIDLTGNRITDTVDNSSSSDDILDDNPKKQASKDVNDELMDAMG